MYFLGSRVDNVCIVLWEERKISLCAITFSYFSDWWVILYNLTSAQWMDLPQQSPSSYEYMSLTGCSNTLCKQFNCFVTENFEHGTGIIVYCSITLSCTTHVGKEVQTSWDTMWDWISNDIIKTISIIQFSSVAQLCPTLCDPMNCSKIIYDEHSANKNEQRTC